MRRALLTIPLLAAALVAGCGGATGPSDDPIETVKRLHAAYLDDDPEAACVLFASRSDDGKVVEPLTAADDEHNWNVCIKNVTRQHKVLSEEGITELLVNPDELTRKTESYVLLGCDPRVEGVIDCRTIGLVKHDGKWYVASNSSRFAYYGDYGD
ncbi:hypothetical protein ET495_14895 [Xylanimonas allomyrinae]|uniref:Nuclear transport factor 2 family protein n=1 Tax=Xylanimonas allomyrinae TaxID=2509459 RepID=A0A4P6ERY8_9MICO|nr:hypothetical protein [Xylanimonas allomyrinae]QAY64279.1 hypothetical protein ET495_14895 [Xylanimonas allomyrinae]